MQNGEWKALKPHQVESSTVVQLSRPALTSSRKQVSLCIAYMSIKDYTSVFLLSAEMFSQDKLKMKFCLLFESYILLLPCRISHEQLYTVLFRTVKPGATMRGPIPAASKNYF